MRDQLSTVRKRRSFRREFKRQVVEEESVGNLVMGRRPEAYVALHRWLPGDDTALILAIRHSREAGYFDL